LKIEIFLVDIATEKRADAPEDLEDYFVSFADIAVIS